MIANAFQGFGYHEYVYALCDFAGVFDHIAWDDANGVVILHVKFFIVFNKDVGGFGVVACQYVNGAGEQVFSQSGGRSKFFPNGIF